MPETIFKKLKELGRIVPDAEYSRTSLIAILRHYPQKPLGGFGTLFFRIGLTGAVLAVIVFGTIKSEAPLKLAGLDSSGLLAEAEELDLQLRLTEVSAAEDQPTTTALKEAAQNGPGHLNTSVIKKESPEENFNEYANPDVDKALEALNE